MKKIILLLTVLISMMSGCTGVDNTTTPKHRNIAVQAYSYNRFTTEETLQKVKGMGLDGIELYPGQKLSAKYPDVKVGYQMNEEQRAYLKQLLKDANLKAVSFGVTRTKDDDEVKKTCEFAKDMGITRVLTEDPVMRFAAWDKYGKEYGVTMCLHHHTFSGANQYFDPYVMRKYVKQYDNVMGNPDIGHWSRCGIEPLLGIKVLKSEIGSIHFKDQKEFGNHTNQCVPLGTGALDMKAMLAELDKQGYDGFFVLEYENADTWDNPTPDIEKCVEYLRSH